MTLQKWQVICPGKHEPIISNELWDVVQRKLAGCSHATNKVTSYFFVLFGLLICPACGDGMIPAHVSRKLKSGHSKRNHYYVCERYSSSGSAVCLPNSIRVTSVEKWVNDPAFLLFI